MIVRFGDHSTTLLGPGQTGDCARAELSRFLQRPGGGPGRCSAESYHALGSFPPTAAALPVPDDQRDIAVGFTTVTDALIRRDPFARLPAPQLPGLRGGAVVFDDAGSAISLRDVRYVADRAVSGTIRYDTRTGQSSADLTLEGGQRLSLAWTAFRAEETTRVSGSLDGRPFTIHIGHS